MKTAKTIDGRAINKIAAETSCSRFNPLLSTCIYQDGLSCSCRTVHEKKIIYKLFKFLEKFVNSSKVEKIRSYLYSKDLYK